MNRFDVDYHDEERGIQHFPCEDGEYVLADDAINAIRQIIYTVNSEVEQPFHLEYCPHGAPWGTCEICPRKEK